MSPSQHRLLGVLDSGLTNRPGRPWPSQPHQPTILSLMQFLLSILFFAAAATAPYDLVIRNGHVIDGTGSPWYAGDVAIRGGRIAAIGRLDGAAARRTLDARGMVVAPG